MIKSDEYVTLDDVISAMPAEEQAEIQRRYEELRAEYLTLQDLRRARDLTQTRMAELLQIKQENVSRLENRTDMLLSTLRSYVQALGGDMHLLVTFPDRKPVALSGIGENATVLELPKA